MNYTAYTTSPTIELKRGSVQTGRVRKNRLLNQTSMGTLLIISEGLMSLHWLKSLQMEMLFMDEGTGWTQRPTFGMMHSRVMAVRQRLQAQLCYQPALDLGASLWALGALISSFAPEGHWVTRFALSPPALKPLSPRQLLQSQDRIRCCIE